jgi:pimeloyl-ACP methyl ester carboxylesterase
VPDVSEHTAEIDGLPVFWRSAPVAAHRSPAEGEPPATGGAASSATPVLYLHGVPTSSDEWTAFLERTGGIAPDLLGFGRSGKPGYLSYTIGEYAWFIERFLDMLELERVRMVVHDWGAVGLAFAQAPPERVERLAIMNAVPFLPGYRWHRTARIWRTPALVVWGTADPYIPARFAREYARVLPNARLLELPDAGHWWWLDRLDAIEQVAEFLDS